MQTHLFTKLLPLLSLILIILNDRVIAREVTSNNEPLWSQIDNINISTGLTDNGVAAQYKDSRGYLWIATYNGLNCYNGYLVKSYKNSLDNDILPSNRVRAINEDCEGRLWIGTDEGLVVYDYNSNDFIIKEDFYRGGVIRQITIIDKIIYAISENNGILRYDMQLNFLGETSLNDNTSFSDYVRYENLLLIASSKGIVEYSLSNHRFKRHLESDLLNLNTIILDGSNTLFVGNERGLTKVGIQNRESHINLEISVPSDTQYEIKQLFIDSNNGLWIGTMFDGLVYIPNHKERPDTKYQYLTTQRISGQIECSSGDMWISTFNDGVYRLCSIIEPFKSPLEQRALRMPLIDFLDDERLLIKSNRTTHIYNVNSETYEIVPIALQNIFNNNSGQYLIDSKGRIWLIGHSGCYRYDSTTDRTETLNNPNLLALKSAVPMNVTQDEDGNIWVGYSDDLFRISLNKSDKIVRVESILRNDFFVGKDILRVRKIYHDTDTNSFWVGTDLQGLYIITIPDGCDLQTATVKHYCHDKSDDRSLSSNFVSSIIKDQNGVMWVGTEQGGFCRVDQQGDELKFDSFTDKHGLSNNVVKAIQCDSKGRLWIATNVGLNSFDPIKERFRSYHMVDGLSFESFLYSTRKGADGRLFFTGSNKFLYFNPDDITDNESIPMLYFNGLKIYDRTVNPNEEFDGRIIIDSRLSTGDSFTLNHDQNSFSVGVDVIYEQNASYHHYHYKLEPINRQWITSHISNNEISLNGLSPGRYTLKVKASNSYGDMTPEQHINIRVKRPIYGSVVAYIIYSLILMTLVLYIFYTIMHNQSLRLSLIHESQEKESLRRANAEKQQYFSNISHELKTPLTLIMAPLSILTDRFKLDVNIKANLAIMQRQVRKMLQLIDLAHGIQLSDENLLQMCCERFIVRDLLRDISEDFEFLAKFDNKDFSIEYPDSVLSVYADRSMLEKILNNLLNNAFKYTTGGDAIAIHYRSQGRMLTLTVSDSGAGIQQRDLEHIFERFYTSESIETKKVGGTGIGLAFSKYMVELHGGTIEVRSEYGRGTTFTLKLPIVVKQQGVNEYDASTEEIVDEKPIILGSLEMDSEIEIDEALRERLVYVVEDNGEMRAFISDIVGRYFNVKPYSSAKECLEAMESQWPDIIVSDVMMPEMNGDRLCEIIKSDLRTSHIPIILLTARYTVDDKIKGIELGADSYIGKPFYPKHLITRINALLRSRQRLFEHFQKGLPDKLSNIEVFSTRDSELLSSLYAIFDKNLDNELIELDTFATELGLNRSLFYSKVKALTNMSPYEMLKCYRLQRANKFILSGKYNINEVCDMVGFKSRTHFSRVYKEQFGVSPSKAIKKTNE